MDVTAAEYGQCRKCGESVVYRRFPSGKYAPYTYIELRNSKEEILTRDPGGRLVYAYGSRLERHNCKPEDVDRYRKYLNYWRDWANDRDLYIKACW